MALADIFIDNQALKNQRDKAKDIAREQYDPGILNPQEQYYRQLATEGISEGREGLARSQAVQSLFRDQDLDIYGGNQAAALAGQQQRSRSAQSAMSDFESNLTRQDIQAQQQGRQGFAQTQTRQNKLQSQQDAALEEADLQYQTELQRRRQKVGQTALQIGATLATIPFGGSGAAAGASLASRGLSALFGGGEEQEQGSNEPLGKVLGSMPSQPEGDIIEPDLPSQEQLMEGVNLDLGSPIQQPTQTKGQQARQAIQEDTQDKDFLSQAFRGFETQQRETLSGETIDLPSGMDGERNLLQQIQQSFISKQLQQESDPNTLKQLLQLSEQIESGQNVDLSQFGYNPQEQFMNMLQ